RVATLDVGEHLLDCGGRERVANRGANRLQLSGGVPSGLSPASGPECLPHPFGDGQALPAGDPLNLAELGVVQDALQTLTQGMSMINAWLWVKGPGQPARQCSGRMASTSVIPHRS